MAFPSVLSVTPFHTESGSETVPIPATTAAGDLLLMFFSGETWAGNPVPSGWTQEFTATNGGIRLAAFGRVADGNEPSTVSINHNVTFAFALTVRIAADSWSGNLDDIKFSSAATGNGSNPNPPALDTGETKEWLWIAAATIFTFVEWSAPSGYGNLVTDNGSGNDNALAIARRNLEASSDNPGNFGTDDSDVWVAITVAVPPVGVAVTGEIDLDTFDASPTFHAPTIQGTVHLAHLDASASFAAPTVAAASVDLEAFDASPTFHDPTIAAASVDLAHLDASATFHDPTLFDNSVQLGHLDASATFHDLTVSGSVTLDAFDAAPVFHDTEVAGSVTLDALDASASFHDPMVAAASVDLDPFDASATFHTLSVSGEGIGLAHLAATATFHTLTVGATTVDLEHLAATAIFHGPLVIPVIVHSPGVGKTAGVAAGARTAAPKRVGVTVGDGQFGITKGASNVGEVVDPAGEGGS